MCKIQCLLSLVALSINLVYSWDIAITNGDQLEFYANNTKIKDESSRFRALTALAYDAAYNMLLFVDMKNDNASIFSFHLATKKTEPLVAKRSFENIQGLAFDPVTSKMFWTDRNEKSIFWTSLKSDTPRNNIYGNLLIKMDDEIPRAIAVDSCRGYVYWTNVNITKPTIEMARFDGSDRRVIVDTHLYSPVSLSLDQRTKRLYWADDKEGIYYSIESSDLDGKNRKTILHDLHHQPNALTVSKDFIYWVDWGYKSIWKIPKDSQYPQPETVASFTDSPFGIVANYPLEDQTESVPECEPLANILRNESAVSDSFNLPSEVGLFCLYGVKDTETYSTCKCFPGYTGERCQTSICQNYCLNGDCNVTEEGNPNCVCKPGFSGSRCQSDVCENHCLNDGKCSLDGAMPVCKCGTDYEGDRCEKLKVEITTTSHPEVLCNCSETRNNSVASLRTENISEEDGLYVDSLSCSAGWDPIRDPILMVLGVLCGLLCLTCAVLITKILQLKKRPRIKKRIIVNKNVTPLTARPDQCEITIENCCNMNICETPCFEPRNSIRPTLLDSKPGKEEKKNLIANMENADDFY